MGADFESDRRISDPNNDLLKTVDVSRMLHRSEACIHNWRKNGTLPDYALPRQIPGTRTWLWSKAAILRFIAELFGKAS